MKWIAFLVALLLITSCIILPVTAKKDKNESDPDDSNFTHTDPQITLSAYEIENNGHHNNTKINNSKPNLNKNSVVEFESTKSNYNRKDIVYVFKKTSVKLFNNSSEIMQHSHFPQSPVLELYYGYGRSLLEPWQYYYRIDDCDNNGTCKYVRADYGNRSVSVGYANETYIQSIIDSGVLPEYGALV